jgi:uncharacterized membrane protein YebE (DUF533 family)
MVLAQRPPQQPAPSRAAWLVPLGLGVGGPLVALLITVVGLGYDFFMGGKMPHPFVVYGLAMLSAPFLAISYENYREYREGKAARALPPSPTTIRQISEANQRHSPEVVEQFIAAALAELNRQVDERFVTSERPITIRQLGRLAQQEGQDDDCR